jgi:hypothetical protein
VTAATWVRVWSVHRDGNRLLEHEASTGEARVSVRSVNGRGRGTHYTPASFARLFADSPHRAIDKFIIRLRGAIGSHRAEVAVAEMLIVRAENLRLRVEARAAGAEGDS